jgi:hypothetical protein
MRRRTRGILIVLSTVVAGIGLSVLSFKLGIGIIGSVIGFLVLVLITVLSDFLAKPWQELLDKLFATGRRRPVRVIAFAAPGTGKSTLQERLLSPFSPSGPKPTAKFNIRESTVLIDTGENVSLRVAVCDYAGQDMSQIFLDEHKEFFGDRGEELVDVLFLLLDIIGSVPDDNGNTLSDEDLVRLYSKDADSQISLRVGQHEGNLGPGVIDTVLKKCGAETGSLHVVRVVVTKIDLARQLAQKGYIKLPEGQSVEDCLLEQYREVSDVTARLCEEKYRIRDYRYYCANLKTGEGILEDWKQILQRLHSARLREEGHTGH